MALSIEPGAPRSAEAGALLQKLDEALSRGYSPDQQHGLSLDALEEDHVHFFLARLDGTAIGCGALALFDGFAEIKRMFAAPSARRGGVGKALVAKFEETALEHGRPLLRLETGIYQHEALQFYERLGFERRPPFGAYLDLPPHTTETSIFFEKAL
ncbi:MAG: GNAT family N-acetyltransferase [Alphaproteobacteria bacterium]|nr:GNAT family N-acetyltransferase [Alphaproteobacteria bacterium]